MANVIEAVRHWADEKLREIEEHARADVVSIISPITRGLEQVVRIAIDAVEPRRTCLLVILDTPGGIVEVVERLVRVFRHSYGEVWFLVPDRALSAGTVLVMSGDRILMDYHSCLGPIDPQVERGGKLVPALSYLVQYARLIRKAGEHELSSAEAMLLQKLDLAELHQFELARQLSESLLRQWLAQYKFKDWNRTEGRGLAVDRGMREERAAAIAAALSDHERWSTHARGIDMQTLRHELKLRIEDFGEDEGFSLLVRGYAEFLSDHMSRSRLLYCVHSRGYF